MTHFSRRVPLLWEEQLKPYGNLKQQFEHHFKEELRFERSKVQKAAVEPEPKDYLDSLDNSHNSDYPGGMTMTNPSMAAFKTIKPVAPTLRQVVLDLIIERGNFGATDDEVEFITGMKHQTASARRRELVLKGQVRDSGVRRATRSGCKATVWVSV